MIFISKARLRVACAMFTLMIICHFSAKAQSELSGVITNSNSGDPLPGVVVRLEESFAVAITDEKGAFRFEKVYGKEVHLTTSHISYEPLQQTIALPAQPLRLHLKDRTFLSDEVNITATRVSEHAAFANSSVSKTDLEKINLGQDLPILLQSQTSVTTTSDAGNGVGYTGIRIRGSDATRVNVTINGIPLNDAESHQVYWVDLPDIAASVDNIQIQRGVGTSTNGAGSFGGSVNIQTDAMQTHAYGELSSSAGSFNTFRNAIRFGSGLLNHHFSVDGRVSMINSDGYIDRAKSALSSVFLSGGYYDEKQSLRLILISGKEKTYQSWYGVPQDSLNTNRTFNAAGIYFDNQGNIHYYDNQTDNYRQNHLQLIYSRSLATNWNLNAALHYTHGKGYYQEYVDETIYGPVAPYADSSFSQLGIIPSHIQQRWLNNGFYGMTWSLNHSIKRLELNIGGALNTYDGDHYDIITWQNYNTLYLEPHRYYQDNARKTDGNIFAKANFKVFNHFYLTGDLQFRQVYYAFTGKDATGADLPSTVNLSFFNPKAGISYEPSQSHRFYASVSVGQKEPVREDYRASTASSRPQSEYLTDYEGGYHYSGQQFTGGINVYYMDYRRQLVLNGKINDVGEFVRESIGDSYRAGIELEGTWAITKKWLLTGNITASQNKIKAYDQYVYDDASQTSIRYTYFNMKLAYSPDLISAASIHFKPLKSINLSLITKYVGEQFMDNTTSNERKISGYINNDLRAEWTPSIKGFKKVCFRAAVLNLFDAKYSTNGYTYYGNYYFPQAGINFMGGITVGW